MGTVQNIKIEPMNVTWGEDVAQVVTVGTRADIAGDLNNDYFFLYSPTTKFHVWIDVGNTGADPAPAGSTAVEVDIASGATATAVATAVASAVNALAGFSASSSGNLVTITSAAVGASSTPHEGVGTQFTFGIVTEGDQAADVGFIDGDIEFSISEDKVDVTAHQKGTNVLSQLRTGKQVELTINFKETTVSQLKRLIRAGGGTFTPVGATTSEVAGWGTHKDFTQTIAAAKKLVLHPVVLGAGDKSRDVTVHHAYPQLESLTFSGENIFMIPVTFKCYPKESLNDRVEYFVLGDSTQSLV